MGVRDSMYESGGDIIQPIQAVSWIFARATLEKHCTMLFHTLFSHHLGGLFQTRGKLMYQFTHGTVDEPGSMGNQACSHENHSVPWCSSLREEIKCYVHQLNICSFSKTSHKHNLSRNSWQCPPLQPQLCSPERWERGSYSILHIGLISLTVLDTVCYFILFLWYLLN